MKKIIKISTVLTFTVMCLLCTIVGYYYFQIPDKYYLSKGEDLYIRNFFEITATKSENNLQQVSIQNNQKSVKYELKLFGVLPIKTVEAKEIDRPALVPCGTPFGIKILTEGVIVTDFGTISQSYAEDNQSPAKAAGLEKGDIILKINGIKVTGSSCIPELVELDSKETKLEIYRNGENKTITAIPQKSETGELKLGLWVRDSTAGIGTMTYYDSTNKIFGGLGHAVCDVDTGQQLPISSGSIVPVNINSVQKGYSGYPGELCGSFVSLLSMGQIDANTSCGLFGRMDYAPSMNPTVPMALKQEVEVGKATILTTLDGNSPQEYDIIIEKIEYNAEQVKNMVIKITDSQLLNEAGGIVQGMSGSPILQNGKLVGAVTHVFVNDPTHGYGIFAENMYSVEKEIIQSIEIKKAA